MKLMKLSFVYKKENLYKVKWLKKCLIPFETKLMRYDKDKDDMRVEAIYIVKTRLW